MANGISGGEMGMFGMAFDEMKRDTWDEQFAKLLDDLPPDAWITVVDCHI